MKSERGVEILRILPESRYQLANGTIVGHVTTQQLQDYYHHVETSLGGCVEAELFVTNLSDMETQLNLCWHALHSLNEAMR